MSLPITEEECREFVLKVTNTKTSCLRSTIARAADHAAQAKGFKSTKAYIEHLIVKDLNRYTGVFNAIHFGKEGVK